MHNLFDINPLSDNVTVKVVNNTKIYIKDNFYKNPNEVADFILSQPCNKWKSWESPSYNGTHFLDQRHDFYDERMIPVSAEIEKLCNEKVAQPRQVVTNCMTFYDKLFNNYNDNYWGPHSDLGYTALIYLNLETCEGTNFYEQLVDDPWPTPEHYEPWRLKSRYKLIDTVESKFNRMVLFNGAELQHGMSINSDLFFNKLRINQAIFLTP
jgi:hypothetical protein|tara:strand:+ start:8578 stop:9207 length:630 start_codon:yes stop_codon:yes gene_type:complete